MGKDCLSTDVVEKTGYPHSKENQTLSIQKHQFKMDQSPTYDS